MVFIQPPLATTSIITGMWPQDDEHDVPLIDRAAAAHVPQDSDVREWALDKGPSDHCHLVMDVRTDTDCG